MMLRRTEAAIAPTRGRATGTREAMTHLVCALEDRENTLAAS